MHFLRWGPCMSVRCMSVLGKGCQTGSSTAQLCLQAELSELRSAQLAWQQSDLSARLAALQRAATQAGLNARAKVHLFAVDTFQAFSRGPRNSCL